MARIRSIKPDYWKSDSIARLPLRCRLTFIALWSYVDDNGVGRDNVKLIAAEIYPLEDDPREALAMVREDLAILARESRVIRYTVDDKPYLAVANWSEHQKIDRPNKARYPQPDDERAVPLTCEDLNPRATLAQPSRNPRADSSLGAVDQGAGSREQGNRGVAAPPPASRSAAINVRAQRLARTYTDVVKLSNSPAVQGIVKKAMAAEHSDEAITDALSRLAAEGRPVTTETLRVELEGLPPPRPNGVHRSTTDQRVEQGLTLARRFAEEGS